MTSFSAVESRGKSQLCSWTSKGSFKPLLQLDMFPGIPVSTREEHGGSCHKSRGSPLSARYLEMSVLFPAFSGKDSRLSRFISGGGAHSRKDERNSRGRVTIPKDPQNSQSTPGETDSLHRLDSQPEYRLSPQWTLLQPTAPRGKATDPCVNSLGSLTLLLQLGRKADVHVPTRDKA